MTNARALIVVLAALALGCASANLSKTMESWVGHSTSELIEKWGPPDSVVPDGKGGQCLHYVDQRSWYNYLSNQTRTWQQKRTFCAKEDGTIYWWQTRG